MRAITCCRPLLSTLITGASCAGLLLLGSTFSEAAQYESRTNIEKAAREFLLSESVNQSARIKVRVGRLDSRLRLAKCSKELETFSPPGRKKTGRTTIGVRCNGNPRWTLYVPATVSVMDEVVIAAQDLQRGAIITPADVALETRDLSRLSAGYLRSSDQAVGQRVKRTVRQGRVIKPSQVTSPKRIKKGAEVTILANSGAIQVRAKGKALGAGGLGDRIPVRNIRSNKVVDATVIAAGTVQVDF